MAHWRVVLNGTGSKAWCSACGHETPGATPQNCPKCEVLLWAEPFEDITEEYLRGETPESDAEKKSA